MSAQLVCLWEMKDVSKNKYMYLHTYGTFAVNRRSFYPVQNWLRFLLLPGNTEVRFLLRATSKKVYFLISVALVRHWQIFECISATKKFFIKNHLLHGGSVKVQLPQFCLTSRRTPQIRGKTGPDTQGQFFTAGLTLFVV